MSDRLGTRLKKPSSEAWNVLFGEKQLEAQHKLVTTCRKTRQC
jgi:hypothetical protein